MTVSMTDLDRGEPWPEVPWRAWEPTISTLHRWVQIIGKVRMALARSLRQADRVMKAFQSGFIGKASPVHLVWGSFDLAASRQSGRPAAGHPSSAPNCPDWVTEKGLLARGERHRLAAADPGPRTGVLRVHLPGTRGIPIGANPAS